MKWSLLILLLGTALNSFAAAPSAPGSAPPPADGDHWKCLLAVPGWMPGIKGDAGVQGFDNDVNINAGKIIRHYDLAVSLRGEIAKGRFGLMADLLTTSMSDGIGSNSVVKKVDLRVDQTIGELAARCRLFEGPRGFVDGMAGARAMQLYQHIATQANEGRIDKVSQQMVEEISRRLRNGEGALGLRDLISSDLDGRAGERSAGVTSRNHADLGIAPLDARERNRMKQRLLGIIESRRAGLEKAIRAQAVTPEEIAAAQANADEIKKELSQRLAVALHHTLANSFARADWWIDPFVGLRGLYNFNHVFYLTGRGDVGGFGVGSKLSWSAEAALGCHVTRHWYAEAGYRALGVDYDSNGLLYNVVMRGAQVTVGYAF